MGISGKAGKKTFKTKKISDEREICMREYANRVLLDESELRYASKNLEGNSLFVLAIPYPSLLQWHSTLSEKSSQKISELLDYTFLLEVLITAAVYRKTTGRAKQQLENEMKYNNIGKRFVK